ncbi:MAG: Apre_1838 family putative sactipeptide bacteriocin [Clostridiales bacterium]|uniref:Apre_1838 family putative sactipeptide bacteriocin n=1 Tax=Terrisporobacter sp. TaxID=1965305 RepID=UPI002A524DA4|nr:Apre_1838 family putative sactipeptide bacteriocin [Terrisporobacter sp.]MDD7757248.1 Apre_1838 family putative sactipeptide bacteriocin [Clostridiales bacterium]MDY4136020.1 Apre_1838 family putative sactipeptide bacteriocin [Terrisporobacter sp.]MDY4737665.1 Apre_1838 family putative sactipeptide bacteriocin [Terrisporobacter sp.]
MKLINPIGRSIGDNNSGTARACMCGTNYSFAGAQGSNDSCFHCGCDCSDSPYQVGNRQFAITSVWKSDPPR